MKKKRFEVGDLVVEAEKSPQGRLRITWTGEHTGKPTEPLLHFLDGILTAPDAGASEIECHLESVTRLGSRMIGFLVDWLYDLQGRSSLIDIYYRNQPPYQSQLLLALEAAVEEASDAGGAEMKLHIAS